MMAIVCVHHFAAWQLCWLARWMGFGFFDLGVPSIGHRLCRLSMDLQDGNAGTCPRWPWYRPSPSEWGDDSDIEEQDL